MPDPVHLQADWLGDVVANQLEAWVADPVGDVALSACEVIIETDHLLPGFHQPVNEVRPHKTSPASHQVAGNGVGHRRFRG